METLYRLPFAVLECPNIKLKRPGWVHMPSAMTVYALVVVSYFLITGGEAGAGRAGGARGRPRLRSGPFSAGRAAGPCPGSGGRLPRSASVVKGEPRPTPGAPAVLKQFLLLAATIKGDACFPPRRHYL